MLHFEPHTIYHNYEILTVYDFTERDTNKWKENELHNNIFQLETQERKSAFKFSFSLIRILQQLPPTYKAIPFQLLDINKTLFIYLFYSSFWRKEIYSLRKLTEKVVFSPAQKKRKIRKDIFLFLFKLQ
jgi:hypothetical protein